MKRFGVHLLIIGAAALTLLPVLWVLQMSLSPYQRISFWPLTLGNFRAVVTTQDSHGHWLFLHQLKNSFVVASGATLVGVAVSCTAAYALSRFRFFGRELSLQSFLLTQMFPGVVTSIPLYVLMDRLGLLNQLSGLVLVYATTAIPFCVFMLKGFFDSLPPELEEAVLLDGGSRFDAFFCVALPLSRPALVITALVCFMTGWNEFILAATFLSDPLQQTLPIALERYVGDYSIEWGRFAAGSILVSLPVMALFFALEKHLVGGLTAGGVKH